MGWLKASQTYFNRYACIFHGNYQNNYSANQETDFSSFGDKGAQDESDCLKTFPKHLAWPERWEKRNFIGGGLFERKTPSSCVCVCVCVISQSRSQFLSSTALLSWKRGRSISQWLKKRTVLFRVYPWAPRGVKSKCPIGNRCKVNMAPPCERRDHLMCPTIYLDKRCKWQDP